MRRETALRNVVCPEVNPSGFDLGAFQEGLDLGPGESVMRLDNISVTEWEKVRLQVLPDHLQLGFKPGAESGLVRRVTEVFLSKHDDLGANKPVGFNAAMMLILEEGESDPSERVVNAQAMAESLGGGDARAGVTLVYKDDLSRWWIELSPLPDQDQRWSYDFNRHFPTFPAPGEERDTILDWFANIEAGLLAQFETICGGGN